MTSRATAIMTAAHCVGVMHGSLVSHDAFGIRSPSLGTDTARRLGRVRCDGNVFPRTVRTQMARAVWAYGAPRTA